MVYKGVIYYKNILYNMISIREFLGAKSELLYVDTHTLNK